MTLQRINTIVKRILKLSKKFLFEMLPDMYVKWYFENKQYMEQKGATI